jgi:hypothetical protein
MTTGAIGGRAAPFERRNGRIGARGWVAVVVAVAPVVTLWAVGLHGKSSGNGGDSRYSVVWSTVLAHRGAEDVLEICAVLFVLAAAVLWRARSGRLVALVAVGVVLAASGSAWSVRNATRHSTPTPAALNALPRGLSRAQVLARLGEPAAANAQATPVHGGATLPCLLYAVGGAGIAGPLPQAVVRRGWWLPVQAGEFYAALCFADGRLVDRIAV